MSRAFVKEDGPDHDPLPDLPISPHPNWVTPRGLAQLQARLADMQASLAGLRARRERLDLMPEAAAERDIRYLEARLRTAIPVPLPAQPAAAAFGTAVTIEEAQGRVATWEIVGEDEADPGLKRISPHAPLARALIGAEPGDVVEWRQGPQRVRLVVLAVAALADGGA